MVFQRSVSVVQTLVAALAYVGALGVGGIAVSGLIQSGVERANLVLDHAAGGQTGDLPRALQFNADRWSDTNTPATNGAAGFSHARPAPLLVERDDDDIERLKTQVSEERFVNDDSSPWHDKTQRTYRTMCVRLCDGAYFPISYATTRDNFGRDEATCAARCGSPARLFVFANPGGSPESMQDRDGRSYIVLPTAFQFRKGRVEGCSCRAQPWEEASRERHALYAMARDQAEGRAVDHTLLTQLQTKFAPRGLTTVASGEARAEKAKAPAARAGGAVDREDIRLPEAAQIASLAPVQHESVAGAPVEDVRAAQPKALPATPELSKPIAGTEQPVLRPTKGLKGAKAIRRTDTRASRSSRGTRMATWRKRDLAGTVAVVAGNGDYSAGEPPRVADAKARVSVRVPRHVIEREIWGVGRNAHSAPKGSSASETFARNFY